MSIVTNVNNIADKLHQIHKEIKITIENKFGLGPAKYIFPYCMNDPNIILPFAYAVNVLKLSRPQRTSFPAIEVKFTGTLRPEQKILRKEALTVLSRRGSLIISAYTGFGKTSCAINLATNIGFITLIIVNKIILIKQWKDSILKFCPDAKVQCITPKSRISIPGTEFYIINAQNVEKMPRTFFQNVGLCIIDEAHLIMAETLFKCLLYVYPRYLIGLTATPYRPDGLNKLLDLYFGPDKIIRKLFRPHTVYKVHTKFKPPVEKTIQGRVNWGAILDAQAKNEDRNELIIRIIQSYPTRNFLVLIKRVVQGEYLLKRLRELNEHVTDLIGGNQEFDHSARILIGTCQKVGIGFDHSKLDTLMLATDIEEYFIQYLGRVFRTEEAEPVIFDLVDENKILQRHFSTREGIYLQHGGTIKNF